METAGTTDKSTGRKKRQRFFFFLIFLLLLAAAFGFYRIQKGPLYLVVSAPPEGEVIYRIPVKEGQEFALKYTHSVTQRPVEGTFLITADKKIKPLTTSYDAFGPGLPYLDGSLEYTLEEGLITVFHVEEPRENIRLFASPLTGEVLRVEGRDYDLGNLRPEPFLLEIAPRAGAFF